MTSMSKESCRSRSEEADSCSSQCSAPSRTGFEEGFSAFERGMQIVIQHRGKLQETRRLKSTDANGVTPKKKAKKSNK